MSPDHRQSVDLDFIRLDVVDRDQGKVHSAYYEDLAGWKDEEPITHILLDRARRGRGNRIIR